MSNILQYAPWCKIYIITERPWEGIDKAHAISETVQEGIKYLQQKHEEEGETTISKEEYEQAFNVGANCQVYNVSKDIITGQVRLGINQAHSMSFTLANPDGRYTNLFMSNDRVILFLKRVKVVQAFSGFLDGVPVKTMRKSQPVSFTATCTMKRLINTYWNPYIYFGRYWVDPGILPEEYLHYLLEEVGGWKKGDVYIQPFHDTVFWNQLAEYSIEAPASSIIKDAIESGVNAASEGAELIIGDALDAGKIDDFLSGKNSPMAGSGKIFVEMGKKYGINPALVLAIAGHESEYGTSKVTGAVYLTKPFNYWGWGGQRGFKSFSSMSAAVEEVSSWIKSQYLTPGAQYYKDGTIAGMSYAYVEPSGQYVDSWTKSVTSCYNQIMEECANLKVIKKPDGRHIEGEQVEDIGKRVWGNIDSGSGTGTKRNVIVTEAYAQIGKPYVRADRPGWHPPDNFDCSTFVRWCYAKAGLDMPAPTTAAMARMKSMNKYVQSNDVERAIREMQPGDVIHWYGVLAERGEQSPPSHTGIYVGNGKMVHAGSPVQEADVRGYHQNSTPIWGWGTHEEIGGAFTGDLPGGSQLEEDGLNTMLYDLLGFKAPGALEKIKGVYQLAVQQRLLDHILSAAQFGMYVCNTDGTGRFIARWSDYFAEEPDAEGNSGPHFSVEDIEIINGSVQVNDMNMVTHQFVIGDSARNGSIDEADWKNANFYDEDGNATGDFGIAVTAFNSERLGILNESEWTAEDFIKRFGYRPSVKEEMLINNVAQAQYYSEYLFRTKWASYVTGNLQTTFLPEVRPMMVIKIPSWKMQFYVQSVTHTFGTKFGSSFSLIAGAFLDDSLGSRNPMLAKINSSPIGDNYNLAIEEASATNPGEGAATIFGPEDSKSPFSWFNFFKWTKSGSGAGGGGSSAG